jgi:DnaA family protein
VKALNEEQLPGAMRLRAKARGLTLPDRTIEYLLRRFTRDSSSLFSILDQADEAALQFQRRLTVPFIKEIERSLLR